MNPFLPVAAGAVFKTGLAAYAQAKGE